MFEVKFFNKIYVSILIYKIRTKTVVNQTIAIGNTCLVLKIIKISCNNGIKAKPKIINVITHLEIG